jgi:nickel-dependent lactate racemase
VTFTVGGKRVAVESASSVTAADPPGGEPVDPGPAARAALAAPLGRSLSDRVDPGDEVAVVVTDGTRAAPTGTLLGVLLDGLSAAGVDREAVTVVVGLGLHRPMTDGELAASLGEHADLAVNHDPDAVVRVGAVDGVPVEVHPALADADLVASTGVVEPHQYAGFSGGAKTAVVGAGGEPLIEYTHGPDLLGRPGVRLGRVEDNPFRAFLDRAGDCLDPFCLNVGLGPEGVIGVAAGDGRRVVRELAATVRAARSVALADDFDAVVAGAPAPKDRTLYQASRAATYVALGDRNPLGPGGRILLPARLVEGVGDGRGERRFHDALRSAADADELYDRLAEGYPAGAQRAFVLARVLREHPVTVVGADDPGVVRDCLLDTAPTVDAALAPGDDVLVVPDALHTLLVAPS